MADDDTSFVDALVHLDDARIADIDAWLREASRHRIGDVLWAGTDPLRDPRCASPSADTGLMHAANQVSHASASRAQAPFKSTRGVTEAAGLKRVSNEDATLGEADPSVRVWHALGLHPRWVDASNLDAQLAAFSKALKRGGPGGEPWQAVGEIGLDGRNDSPETALQERAFIVQLEAANTDGYPVIVHCVQRIGRLAEILAACDGARHGGIMHGFGGPAQMISRLSDLGMSFSFGGLLLKENATRSHEAARAVPADRLLIESDAPELGCEQWPRLVRTLAHLRDTTAEDIAKQTANNARRVLRMPTLSSTK